MSRSAARLVEAPAPVPAVEGPKTRKSALTRKKIAQAALDVFAAKGYETATLDDVAQAAGVHKRTLLRQFPTKAHLVLNGPQAAFAQFRDAVANRGSTGVIDVWESHFFRWSKKIAARGPKANISAIAAAEPAIRQVMLDIESQYQALIARALCEELGRDPRTDVFCQVVAAALIGGNYGSGRNFYAHGDYKSVPRRLPEVIAIVRRTLLAEVAAQQAAE